MQHLSSSAKIAAVWLSILALIFAYRQSRGFGVQLIKPPKPDVVYKPTPYEVVDRMLEVAQVGKDDIVYDLGCGDARILVAAAKKYGCHCVGIELDPKWARASIENAKENGVEHLVRIEERDMFTIDLSPATVVALYLFPELNARLIPQMEKMKPGSRIVTQTYDVPGLVPDQVQEMKSEHFDHKIFLYTAPFKRASSTAKPGDAKPDA